jgi:hypothetical protein
MFPSGDGSSQSPSSDRVFFPSSNYKPPADNRQQPGFEFPFVFHPQLSLEDSSRLFSQLIPPPPLGFGLKLEGLSRMNNEFKPESSRKKAISCPSTPAVMAEMAALPSQPAMEVHRKRSYDEQSDSTSRRVKKSHREKQRRSELKEKLDQLSLLLGASSRSKLEKHTILTESVKLIERLRAENAELREHVRGLKERLATASSASASKPSPGGARPPLTQS